MARRCQAADHLALGDFEIDFGDGVPVAKAPRQVIDLEHPRSSPLI
jgi:hypothetical protein